MALSQGVRQVRKYLEGAYEHRNITQEYSIADGIKTARERGDLALKQGYYKTALHSYKKAENANGLMALGYAILEKDKMPNGAGGIAIKAMEEADKLKKAGDIKHGQVASGSFYSKSLGKEMRYNVYLPPGYDASSKKYPAVYFFNAAFDNQNEWLDIGKVDKAVDGLRSKGLIRDMIIVMPDMGNGTVLKESEMTTNMKIIQRWIDVGKYDDYVTKDLIPHIDDKFRTIADRRGRATDGVCQGATNAVGVALKHPDMFSSTAGHTLSYSKLDIGEKALDVKVYMDASRFDFGMHAEGKEFSRKLEKAGVDHVFVSYTGESGMTKKDYWQDLKTFKNNMNFKAASLAERIALLSYTALTPHNWSVFRKRVKNSLMFHSANFANAEKAGAGAAK